MVSCFITYVKVSGGHSELQDTIKCYTYRRVAGMNLIFQLSNAEVDGKFQDANNIVPMSGEI
jgi:hypothetical protein